MPRSASPVLCVLVLAAACEAPVPEPPARADGVPEDAVWAGGVDGGEWFKCVATERSPYRYSCTIFNDYTGTIEARGDYVLRGAVFDTVAGAPTYVQTRRLERPPQYAYYDGIAVWLRDSLVLVPDGWIDHPFGDGWGKRVRYDTGKELEVIQYGKAPSN